MSVHGLKGGTGPSVDSRAKSGRLPSFLLVDTEAVVSDSQPAPDDERNSELTDRLRELGYLE